MNEAEYRAHPAVNYSTLKHMRKSPLHYRHAVDNPEDSGNEYAMLRAVHALVLEPMTAHETIAVWDGRRDKRDKAYCAFLDANAGKDILNPTEHAQALAVSAAYSRNSTVQWLLSLPGTRCEQPHVWTHQCANLELALKGKPDILHYSAEHGLIVADLKTCGDTDARLVASMARKYGWLLQLAHYTLLAFDLWQLDPTTTPVHWLTITAEDKAPFDCTALSWDAGSIIAALQEHAALIAQLERCLLTNQWPGRGELQVASLSHADA